MDNHLNNNMNNHLNNNMNMTNLNYNLNNSNNKGEFNINNIAPSDNNIKHSLIKGGDKDEKINT
jgi:hypothetical protein